eukprot:9176017-Pyramimonas_sp.AAC.1
MMLMRTASLAADPCLVPCQLEQSLGDRRSSLSQEEQRKFRICSMAVSRPMAGRPRQGPPAISAG